MPLTRMLRRTTQLLRPTLPRDFQTRFDVLPGTLSDIFRELDTHYQGITESEAENRLEEFGANQILQVNKTTWVYLLMGNFKNPFNRQQSTRAQ